MSGSWKDLELETRELVDLVVDCFDDESGSASISGSDNVRRFEQIMPILIERIEDDLVGYNISSDHVRSELRDYLASLKDKPDSGNYFIENTDEFEQRIRAISSTQYTVAFPLNFHFRPGRKRDEFSALGYEIERLPRRQWLSRFKEPAEENEEANHKRPGDDPLTSFLDETPNEFSRNHTYWKFEIEARDQDFAVEHLEMVLEYLLGQLNFSALAGTTEGTSIKNTFWPSGWSNLKLPFIYLVFEDDDYTQFYYNTDFYLRKKFTVHSIRQSQFDRYLDEFPEIEEPFTDFEEIFVNALRRFQTAITEPEREDSFLEYWRCAEILTLVDEDDDMKTVIQRVAAPLEHENPELFRFRLERARIKRNKLVHEGTDISVTKEDQNRLKSVLDSLIQLYIEQFDEWNKSDFEFYLDNVDIDVGQLEKAKENRLDQIDIIDEIIEAKEYEPTGLEKILVDWTRHENNLEDANFLDTLGFFLPVFGVGDANAEIMIVAQAPVYPIDEDEEPIRARTRIQGPQPNFTEWTLEKLREFNTSIVQNANPDGIWDVIKGVAEATDQNPEQLYYTTLQKDGKFDESTDEIVDGFTPSQLNRESISQWKPYLKEEIETVEPDLILVFGKTTLEAVVDILSVIEDETAEDIPQHETYVLDRYPIAWFDHFAEIELPDGTSLQEYMCEKMREIKE